MEHDIKGSITDAEHEYSRDAHPLGNEEVKGRDFTVKDDELPPGYFRSFTFIGSLMAIGMSFGCGVGGFGFVTPVLGFINADIGPDPNLAWIALSYLLTSSVGLLIVGRVTDIFGRRWWFVGGNAVGTLGQHRVCGGSQRSGIDRSRDIDWNGCFGADLLCLRG